MKKISLEPLKKALQSLKNAIAQTKNEYIRDSVIQRFEYTFELSWKIIKKVLEQDQPLEDASVKGILRSAATYGIISNLELWFEFQHARNLTSHTYNEDSAEEVYEVAVKLPPEIDLLLLKLSVRN
ncbi:MAG: nucleotidyltransferase substrate binding protein [Oligoflexia bacterium]|nr:nucleotidyltransferase substrate binding protein [Oligoflexia bacterium]